MSKFTSILFAILFLSSCTLSFQNISTHGSASEVADSDPSNHVTADPVLTVPMSAIP